MAHGSCLSQFGGQQGFRHVKACKAICKSSSWRPRALWEPTHITTLGRSAGICGVRAGRHQEWTSPQARRRTCVASATSSGERSGGNRPGWKLGLWTALDVTATLGSVGAAVAFILTQELLLVGIPVVLPLVALYASRQRESALVEATLAEVQSAWQATSRALEAKGAAEAQQVTAALQQLREDLAAQLPAGKLRGIEGKLAALEGSVLSAGRNAQSAARGVDAAGAGMAQAVAAQVGALGQELTQQLRAEVAAAVAQPLKGLEQLDARLEAIQSCVAEVEQSQSKGMRQLAQGLAAAVEDAEASLQRSVLAESRRSLDALHRLPALLAATLPVTDVTPLLGEEEEQGADMRLLPQRQRQQLLPGGLAPADRAWLQELLSAAMERATAQSYRDQAVPALLADTQWEALGKRLRGIEAGLQEVLASSSSGQAMAQQGASEQALAAEVAALRGEVADALERGGNASEDPALAESLTRVTEVLDELRSQVVTSQQGLGAREQDAAAVARAVQPLQAALAGMQQMQAALEDALAMRSNADALEAAAREGARLALADVASSGTSTASGTADEGVREAVSATLVAVRQLEADMSQRLESLAAIVEGRGGAAPSGEEQASGSSRSWEQAEASEVAPKGYKGDPSDTREDASQRMQAVLKANAGSNSRMDSAQQQREGASSTPAQPQQQEQPDMVPIDAWLGQRGGVEASSIAQLEALEASAASPRQQQPASPANGAAAAPWDAGAPPGVLQHEDDSVSSREGAEAQPQAASRAMNGTAGGASTSSAFSPGATWVPEAGAAASGPEWAGPAGGNGAATGYNGNGAGGGGHDVAETPYNGAETPEQQQLEALVAEGKALLREGRELMRAGLEFGRADALLQDALAAFEDAAALDPGSIRVQGNWGNALMAYGGLKKRYLEALAEGPPPGSYGDAAALRASQQQLAGEAEAALVAAGQRFLAVAEQDASDARALGNWGRALCLRAELAADPQVACALYEAAVAKFEAVLEAQPQSRAILRACAFALYDLARLQPDQASRAAQQLLEDAAQYLEDVLALDPGDQDAAAALDACLADIDAAAARLG